MRTIIRFTLLLYSLVNYSQFQFTGELSENHSNKTVYLSHINNYRKSSRVYLDQIISKATTDSSGRFLFEGDNLTSKNNLYRIHFDDCDTTVNTSHFLKECNYTQSILFLAKNTDTVELPLLQTNQALCEINSTNNASSLILEIDALKEEMILDFMEYPSKANETLTFKKWFNILQEFGVKSGEPLAELYIYDFLSERASETHAYYLSDLQTNPMYGDLLNRLSANYSDAAFTEQYERELTADNTAQNDFPVSSKRLQLKHLFLTGLVLLIVSIAYYGYNHRIRSKKSNQFETLTGQEKNIMTKIAADKSNKEIAAELFISLSTVKTHINSIYKKLGVSSREDLKSLL
ncbi:helix-turn-helix transcriptional regulator [Croceitalea rosinachiae]|uniref:Helix-turn-helix transcriptional regulator n=1 Tax=Croceitalea rosinachiae TaxID=3075596 RepID=A0ABU3ADA0_9FLAO|nr:helix-turn-helix transcriptional regulator [Croceitalea sp. F388]MDT0606886.1 helix-turn-helix transcriptional regulator [Croceitalea sp. F388]